MRVLVSGLGNIGTTLANLLLEFRGLLGIDEVVGLRHGEVNPWNVPELDMLAKRGARLAFRAWRPDIPGEPATDLETEIDYAFECGRAGTGKDRLAWYGTFPSLAGACAQGGEPDFGAPYMADVDDEAVLAGKYAHAVSCNTHAIAALLRAACGNDLASLVEADFVVARRCEDVGASERLVGASTVARHRGENGTHHASDAIRLFAEAGIACPVRSSDVTTPSQLMHALRYDISFAHPAHPDSLAAAFRSCPTLSVTAKFDSNAVFELGRRYGFQGRIYSHAIVVANDIMASPDGRRARGWAFVPQEGNTLLTTLKAFLLSTAPERAEASYRSLVQALVRREW